MGRIRKTFFGSILLLCCLTGCRGTGEGSSVSTNGSTSMEPLMSVLIEGFQMEREDVTVTYEATGSGTGITAVSAGTCDIGLSSRDLKENETGITATVVALDGIAVIVNRENPVEDLSVEEIAGLVTGEITDWSQVGGPSMPVAVIGREAGAGTRDGFESAVGVAHRCQYDQEINSSGGVIAAVASNPYAIGYASLSAVNDQIKLVTVAGVPCTEETVQAGSYPLQRPFLLLTRSGETLSEEAQAFLTYAQSEAAQALIVRAGAIPVEQTDQQKREG